MVFIETNDLFIFSKFNLILNLIIKGKERNLILKFYFDEIDITRNKKKMIFLGKKILKKIKSD